MKRFNIDNDIDILLEDLESLELKTETNTAKMLGITRQALNSKRMRGLVHYITIDGKVFYITRELTDRN